MSISLQISFLAILEECDGGEMLFVAWKQQKTILIFHLDSLIVTE